MIFLDERRIMVKAIYSLAAKIKTLTSNSQSNDYLMLYVNLYLPLPVALPSGEFRCKERNVF